MKFSIVIPTRNRAHLLGNALRSALEQDFDDYEVIVSNNFSSDGTREVVQSLMHPRIRYYETSSAMSSPDHWQFALGKVSGDWVLYLCDDDALLPYCLRYLDSAIAENDVLAFHYADVRYVYDDGVDARGGNFIELHPAEEPAVVRVDSRKQLEIVFDSLSGVMPRFLNACVSKELVERINQAHGRVFHRWGPDYTSGVLLLGHTQEYVKINEPLMLWGMNRISYGPGSRRDPAHFLEYFQQFAEFDGRLPYSPYPELLTMNNAILDTIYRVRDLLGGEFRELQVDQRKFHEALLSDVDLYLANGHNEFEKHYRQIAHELRKLGVPVASRGPLRRAYRKARRALARSRPGRSVRARLGGGTKGRDSEADPGQVRKIWGYDSELRFENIYEAARVYPRLVESIPKESSQGQPS